MRSERFLVAAVTAAALLSLAAAEPAPAAETVTPAVPNASSGDDALPPPEAETLETVNAYLEVTNPAFPLPQAAVETPHHLYRAEDVATFFPDGPMAEARAAFDRGAYGRTLALTRGLADESMPVRYLRAQAALKARDYKAAAAELTDLAGRYTALRDRCLVGAATAREQLGELSAAAELLAQVPAQSRLWLDARLNLAKLLVQLKKRGEAAEVLAPLTQLAAGGGRDVGAEALWARADIARREGQRAQEKEALGRLWALHPLSPWSVKAESRLGGAPKDPSSIVDRAEVLVEAHRNRQGMKLLEPLLAKLAMPEPLACRARLVLGKALRKERSHTRAQEILAPVAAKCAPEIRPRALYVLGTSQSIVSPDKGIQTFEILARDFPDHPFADDALFNVADLQTKAGQLDAALERLDAVGKKYPNGDFAAEALFKTFWIQRRQGRADKALAALDEIERRYGSADETYELERARYWRARTLEDGNDRAGAVDRMASLAADHPATYYGLRAREWLERNDAERLAKLQPQLSFAGVTGTLWPLDAGPLQDDAHFIAGVQLLRLGFGEAAAGELLAVKRTTAPPGALRLLVRLLSLAGDTRGSHAIARTALRKDLSGRVTPETRPTWEVAYPNAFRPLIERHCKTANLDPDLLQALMREESALDPRALSWAGALGLTQLMPSTARYVAKGLKMRSPSTTKLLEPDLNIRLGATYLGQLLKQMDGNASFALASYNAGASAVNRWRTEVGNQPLDVWVEEIPLTETRGYVKRVLRSYNTYRMLYAPAGAASGSPAVATERR